MVVLEYLGGKDIHYQLYTEMWKPSEEEILKVALDVAKGLEYLHTAFVSPAGESVPVIHRDLKSPNLMLLEPPPSVNSSGGASEDYVPWVKIADFGLARNKKLDKDESGKVLNTGIMTGCGSVLWMAPEILLGDTYNEKVDVFSFAMCLVELRNRRLPWQGGPARVDTTAVPFKVTRNERPTWQLPKARNGETKMDFLNGLIIKC